MIKNIIWVKSELTPEQLDKINSIVGNKMIPFSNLETVKYCIFTKSKAQCSGLKVLQIYEYLLAEKIIIWEK